MLSLKYWNLSCGCKSKTAALYFRLGKKFFVLVQPHRNIDFGTEEKNTGEIKIIRLIVTDILPRLKPLGFQHGTIDFQIITIFLNSAQGHGEKGVYNTPTTDNEVKLFICITCT